MRELHNKKVKLYEESMEIDPRPTWKLIDEINEKYSKEIETIYNEIDMN
jgi:hypothetical protein